MRAFLKFSFLLAAAGMMQSCFVAKEYTQPDLAEAAEEARYRTDALPVDSTTMAEISWSDLFTDPILVGHIRHALDSNMDIRVALERMAIADAYFKQGKWGNVPTLSLNAQAAHQSPSEHGQFGGIGNLTQFELSGTASWEADIWGRIRSEKRASEAAYLQSVAAHQGVKSRLVAQVASLYYHLLTLEEQKRIAEESIANRESSLETTQALKDAGVLTQVAVNQTRMQLENTRALLVDLNVSTRILENALSVLMGKAPGPIEKGRFQDSEIPEDVIALGYPAQ
ncbi:MAG TPA: TolC family protein, partial [Cryomorphaceae bacterium]|nr:TolC family protein [Cryomorphaceae bacterium]